jgi:hypothetical protein
MKDKISELWQELRAVLAGRNNTLDAILPPLVFTLVNALAGLAPAALAALALAIGLTALRLARKEPPAYAFGGLALTLLSAGLAWFTQSAAGFFVTGLVTGGALLAATLTSLAAGKPLAAWTSHLTRAWPLAWYWLPRVRPAYMEVTWMWAGFIAVRLAAQYALLRQGDALTLGWANTLLDWPATVLVLVISYLYGLRRLAGLGGPGVDEFKAGQPPPWQGQKRGF